MARGTEGRLGFVAVRFSPQTSFAADPEFVVRRGSGDKTAEHFADHETENRRRHEQIISNHGVFPGGWDNQAG